MNESYAAYLSLLREISAALGKLSDSARQKTKAVRQDDLNQLSQILKEEQALSLSLRSWEQKRSLLLEQLGLSGVPLRELAAHYPDDLRLEAKKTVEDLRGQYRLYQGAAEVARNTLECNLHEIEKILKASGADLSSGATQPPPPLRTDFRA